MMEAVKKSLDYPLTNGHALVRLKQEYPISKTISESFGFSGDGVIVALDTTDRLLFIGSEIIRFCDIFHVERLTGDTISSISSGDALGGAIVGGLLFGAVGAVVGSISASQPQSMTSHTEFVGVEILRNDIINPRIVVLGNDTFCRDLYATVRAIIAQNQYLLPSLPSCPECGLPVSQYAHYCVHCGCPADKMDELRAEAAARREAALSAALDSTQQQFPDTVLVPVQVEGGNVRCPRCGKEQKASRSTCFKCGAPFTEEAAARNREAAMQAAEKLIKE